MTGPLRSEILPPTPTIGSQLRRWLVISAGSVVVAAVLGLAVLPPASTRVAVVRAPSPAPRVQIVPVHVVPTPARTAAQPVRSTELGLVFSAGGASYMKLAELGDGREIMPKHGKPRLFESDGIESAVAAVQESDLPLAYRRWQDRAVLVDGTCRTRVVGFAVVSRLSGDPGYAGIADASWTADSVLARGSVVLAAKLAGCTGTYARDAALPAVVVPQPIANAELAAKAKAALIASQPAQDTQREYLEFDQSGSWWDSEAARFETRIVRHPTTGVTWVSVHGTMEHGCGDPEVNVWGLFRVQRDGSLVAVQLRRLGDLWSIAQLVDLDDDGELELIGAPWLGLDTVVTRGNGEELDRLALPFFGCPC